MRWKNVIDWRAALELVFSGFLWAVGMFLAAMLFSFVHGLIFPKEAKAAERIPAAALKYRSEVIRATRAEWGLNAPVARIAAQVNAESRWRENARSPVGARGLAQFMPATEQWYGGLRPDLGKADAWNPGWSLRAMAGYDRWLYERVRGATPCDRMDKAQGSYNSGLGWTYKDEALAAKTGLDPGLWDSLAAVNAGRTVAAKWETNIYVKRIRGLEPVYLPFGPGCAVLEAAR